MEEKKKSIYFIVDDYTLKRCHDTSFTIYDTYKSTKKAIKDGIEEIFTTSIANMSFDLIDDGYDIYLCSKNHSLQIKPGMNEIEKDLRREHNILRLFMAGVFDGYFEQFDEEGVRRWPRGLCEDCFWKFDCMYANENPNDYVRTCDEDGGLSYLKEK